MILIIIMILSIILLQMNSLSFLRRAKETKTKFELSKKLYKLYIYAIKKNIKIK